MIPLKAEAESSSAVLFFLLYLVVPDLRLV